MYYFIVNPRSSSGNGLIIWKKAEQLLQENEVEYEAYFTEYEGHAEEFAHRIAALSIPCTLGVLGGDGTLNEVINGLLRTDFSHITLGYIPSGSGNDFARGLGLPKDICACMKAILSPAQCTFTDICQAKTPASSRYFLVSSGFGYDAAICRSACVSPLKKVLNRLHMGKLIYVLTALHLLVKYTTCSVSLRVDKEKSYRFPRFYFAAGMNLKYEGGGVKFAPNASFEDSLLDICLAGNLSKKKILTLFPTAFFGKHTVFKGVHMLKGRRIDMVSSQMLPVHCDGEFIGMSDHLTMQATGRQINVILR